MTNSQRLGSIWKGRAWDDGNVVTRAVQTDLSYAEGVAALGYVWNGTTWDKVPGDATNGLKVQTSLTGGSMGRVLVQTSTSGSTELLPDTNSAIRVFAVALMANGSVNVKFTRGVGPADMTGLFYLVANTGFVLPFNPEGWLDTSPNEALQINLSANVAVGGIVLAQYIDNL